MLFFVENPRAIRKFDPDMTPPPRTDTLSRLMKTRYAVFFIILRSPRGYQDRSDGAMSILWMAGWKSLDERYAITQDPGLKQQIDAELDGRCEQIEGCVEENVGWMMLDTIDVSVDFYHTICGFMEEVWPIYYQSIVLSTTFLRFPE